MLVTFKVKREGSIFIVQASIKGKEVTVTHEPYQPENFSSSLKVLQHDKDVIISGDKSKRAKGRERYITGIGVLKRWKELRDFAAMPFKRYKGYQGIPTSPIQALIRTRVVWEYLSKYGGGKDEACMTLRMPSQRNDCTLCEYVQFNCSELGEENCREYCPVEWDGFEPKRENGTGLLCYQAGSPYYTFLNFQDEERRYAAKRVLDLVDLAIWEEEQ